MNLDTKDVFATFLALIVGLVFYVQYNGLHVPLISNYRIAAIILLFIGMTMCAVGAKEVYPVPMQNPIMVLAAAMGFISLAIGLIVIITGSKTMFEVLTGMIIILWVMTTLRHLIMKA